MSQFTIGQYYTELEKIVHFGGTKKETAIIATFFNKLNEASIAQSYLFNSFMLKNSCNSEIIYLSIMIPSR